MHKKYSSIENSYRQKYITLLELNGLDDGFWYVLEKMHGSNFAVYLNYNEEGELQINAGSRNNILKPEEYTSFFDCNRVLERYDSCFRRAAKIGIANKNDTLILYGELVGGNYPHTNVEQLDVKRVQKEVCYHPDIEFVIFDVLSVFGEDEYGEKAGDTWWDWAPINLLLYNTNLMVAPLIAHGTLKQCLEAENTYITKVPEIFGLPSIPDNYCEGNVIKSVHDKRLPNGERAILKNKNEKFAENRGEKFKKTKINVELPDELKAKLEDLKPFINDNRLRNVLSKMGEVKQNQFGLVLGNFVKDVYADFYKEHVIYWKDYKQPVKKLFNKVVNSMCAELIRENFVNIIDNNY